MKPLEEPLVFSCGGDRLVGILHHAQGPNRNMGVVFVVGGPQYRIGSHRQFVSMARAISAAGYPVLRFDYRGMGDSSGDFRGFIRVGDDIRAAIDVMLGSRPDVRTVTLFGLCDGASAISMYAGRDARVSRLVLANPWVRTEMGKARAYMQGYYGRRILQRSFWRSLFRGEIPLARRVAEFGRNLWKGFLVSRDPGEASDDFVARMLAGLQSFGGPVLVLLSGWDLTADEFRDLCRRSPEWSRVMSRRGVRAIVIDGADHTFSRRQDLATAVRVCLDWFAGFGSTPARLSAAAENLTDGPIV